MSQQRTVRLNGTGSAATIDPQVKPQRGRRTFTREYKLRVLAEAERREATGTIGALLRQEGLYSSHLTTWRRQQEAGELAPGAAKKRGRSVDKQSQAVAKLQAENEQLRAQLEQATLIIAAQKKFAQALESTLSQPSGGPS